MDAPRLQTVGFVHIIEIGILLTPYNVGYIMRAKDNEKMEDMEKMLCRTFIEVPLFSKRWAEIGLGEEEP